MTKSQNVFNEQEINLARYYRGLKILVVGADGFLGQNCVVALQKIHADLTILTRSNRLNDSQFEGRVVLGDLRDATLMKEIVHNQSIVFNFAGGGSAADSILFPDKNLDEELRAYLSLFVASISNTSTTMPLVINCSTRLVYGKPKYLPVDEKHPLNPESIYAVHKLTAENYLEVFRKSHGLRYINFRLSNPYGPYQSQQYKGYGVINRFLQNAALNKPITLYGDGSQKRDYIYAEDVIKIFLLCAMNHKCEGQVFNIGGRNAVSISEAATLISEIAGGSPIHYVPWPDQSKIIETGDYETDMTKLSNFILLPEECSLKHGFAHTLNYYRSLS